MNNIDYKVGIYIRLSREDEEKEKYQERKSYLDENLYLINEKEFIGMYRWLSREFTTVECTGTCE